MKKAVMASIALISFGFAKLADDIITTLQMTQYSARMYVLGNFVGDFTNDGETVWKEPVQDDYYAESDRFKLPYIRKVIPELIAGDKAAAAGELCAYVRMYVNSEEFMTAYNEKREKAKPTREPWHPRPEDIKSKEESLKYHEQSVADAKKQKLPADKIAEKERNLAYEKARLNDWKDPNPMLTRWSKAYPEDPSPIIKSKLEEYLALAATVDFDATTTGPRRKFTNPVYEKKGIRWKAIYRAGKDVNTVVTAFIKDWLKGEIIASKKIKMPKDKESPTAATARKEVVTQPAAETTSEASSTSDATDKPKKIKKGAMLLKKLKDKVN